MTEQKLRTLLEQLRDELEHTESIDDKGHQLLRDLEKDIDNLLGERPADESTLRLLQNVIDHFEITHPKLTLTLSEIMTVLSNAGI